MKKIKVLVFPCGSEIALEIYESIAFSTHFELYGASSVEDHGAYVYKRYIPNVPQVTDDTFVDSINKVIEENNIDLIFPAHDSVVLRLSEAVAAGHLKCGVVTSPYETCRIARSKKLTYDELKGIVKVPKLYDNDALTNNMFPVFMKPDVGQGSKGVYLAKSKKDVDFYLEKDTSLLVMEYLPGAEYTVDCFTDYTGALRYVNGRIRQRISNGISVSAKSVVDDRFIKIANSINSALKFNGVWFFQVKENINGELVLLEIAPRIAGTMGHSRVYGVNLPLLSLFNYEKVPVDIFKNKNISIVTDRSLKAAYSHDIQYNHVYVDLDDLLILDHKINTRVVGFLFQCINNNKKVYLLTKHSGDINKTLSKYRISNLFDDVIQINDDTEKYTYISHQDAIFIDDSNSERKKVYEKVNIPVFDAHSIDVLVEH